MTAGLARDAAGVVRLWRAAEMFSPRPLPEPCARDNVADLTAGDLMPWEPRTRLSGRASAAGPPAAPGPSPVAGQAMWHQVFGGVFRLRRLRPDLCGHSALFTCTVSESGRLLGGPDVSECAWAAGQLALGDDAAASGDPSSWLTASSGAGRLPVARENLPDLPATEPLTFDVLSRFAADLAELLGVTDLLGPAGLRVRSYVSGQAADPGGSPLAGYFAADLARAAAAVRESAAGLPLLTFLTPGEIPHVDVRRDPLTVRDGCVPDRMPAGRWPDDTPLVLSEQFAVNEILARDTPLTAVDAPPGAARAIFSDLIAAIVTERARALAALPSPDAAFGEPLTWGSHVVAPPAPAVTGFEILVAFPEPGAVPGLGTIGAGWRERAAGAGYFASTARLAGGDPWALVCAHLGDPAECRAFADRFWHGRVHGTEALFSAGEPIWSALRAGPDDPAGEWPAAAAGFRSALGEIEFLSSERMVAAAALARFSALEQECEDAYSALEEAEEQVASLGAREPDARDAVVAAEELRQAALDNLQAHQADRPGLAVSMSTGLRAGREWYSAHAELRAAFDTAARMRDSTLVAAQDLRAELAAARAAAASSRGAAARAAAAMDALQAPVADARKRWGDHVPEGPSYAETEDAALIERRENSAPWSDPEFAGARTKVFLSALALHQSVIHANAAVIEANLAAWADIVTGTGDQPPPEVALAAWQSFFLVVPAVSASFGSAGSLLAGLGRGSVGWLLAAGCGGVPPRHVAGALWRANRAVLAGTGGGEEENALSLAARATRFGTSLPDGTWTGLPLYARPDLVPFPSGGSPAGSPSSDTEMLRAVLSDLRVRARLRIQK